MFDSLTDKQKITLGIAGTVLGSLLIMGFFLLVWSISAINDEAALRNKLVNQEKVVKADVDQVFAILQNQAGLQKSDQERFAQFYPSLMNAKYGQMKEITVAFLKDANPNWNGNLSDKLFKSIESQFTYRTNSFKEYVNLKTMHDIHLDTFPGSIIFKLMGKEKINIVIPVSAQTSEAFKTGQIDNTIIK